MISFLKCDYVRIFSPFGHGLDAAVPLGFERRVVQHSVHDASAVRRLKSDHHRSNVGLSGQIDIFWSNFEVSWRGIIKGNYWFKMRCQCHSTDSSTFRVRVSRSDDEAQLRLDGVDGGRVVNHDDLTTSFIQTIVGTLD